MSRSDERQLVAEQEEPAQTRETQASKEGSPLRSFFYLLPGVLRTLRNGPSTVSFPFGPLELPKSFRGRVEIDADRCRGCSLCVRDCPAFALELHRESRDVFQLIYYPERCAYCGQCELSCNFGAIRLSNTFTQATTDPSSLRTVLVDRKGKEDEDEGSSSS
jgi:formate hydrogenlyase subunit 6/NADH:ubiquinone oxidoreductase subunit I